MRLFLFLSGLFCIARKLALNELDEITPVQQFTTQIGKKQSMPLKNPNNLTGIGSHRNGQYIGTGTVVPSSVHVLIIPTQIYHLVDLVVVFSCEVLYIIAYQLRS